MLGTCHSKRAMANSAQCSVLIQRSGMGWGRGRLEREGIYVNAKSKQLQKSWTRLSDYTTTKQLIRFVVQQKLT